MMVCYPSPLMTSSAFATCCWISCGLVLPLHYSVLCVGIYRVVEVTYIWCILIPVQPFEGAQLINEGHYKPRSYIKMVVSILYYIGNISQIQWFWAHFKASLEVHTS